MSSNLVALIRNLQRRQSRRRQILAIAEGIRLVEEALAADVPFRGAAVSRSLERTVRGTSLRQALEDHAVPVEQVSDAEIAELADTDTPQGIVAVVEHPTWALSDIRAVRAAPVLTLDGVRDPGNVGALLRTACALGAAGAVLLPGTVSFTHPKVLRGAMGTTFRFPVARAQEEEFTSWVEGQGLVLWAASADGAPISRLDPPERLVILVGNEGEGVRQKLKDLSVKRVAIPLVRGVESLNVAVAAGILIHEVVRAR